MTASLRDAAQMVLEAWQTSVYGDERHHKAMLLAMTTLCAAISLPDKPVAIIPAGYKLVPMEPTPEMVDAAFAGKVEDQDVMRQLGRRRAMRADYAAMLDATPQPAPVQQRPVPEGYKLVPLEPTEEMIQAGCLSQQATPEYDNYEDWFNSHSGGVVERIRSYLRKDYFAMLAAHGIKGAA